MKTRIANYTFDASAQTVTFTDYTAISLEGVLLVSNATDGLILYNFADPAKGGSAATNVLTLEYDTTAMDDTDDLIVYYDDGDKSQLVGQSLAVVAAAQMTRPANTTAYASGDLVADNTTAGSVTPMSFSVARIAGGSVMIRRARVNKSGTGITNANFRLHLYSSSPTVTNGDNGVWLSNQRATYLGSLDVTLDRAMSDGAAGIGAPGAGAEISHELASGQTIYGLLEARGAYTPESGETFVVALEVLQN
jgi:hypothetical protein